MLYGTALSFHRLANFSYGNLSEVGTLALRGDLRALHERRPLVMRGQRAGCLAFVLVLGCTLGACAPSGQQAPSPPLHPSAFTQLGLASWYGEAHAGHHTASGESFDPNAMTAAHRTLPLGTTIRVTNVENGRTVTVRINDRGPVDENRIIDLSRAAADALGFRGTGIAKVRLDGF